MRPAVLSLVPVLGLLQPALAALYTSPAQLPAGRKYDYVVVGGGLGGGVVAARLAETASKNVLLIEAGPRLVPNRDIETIAIPFLCVGLAPDTPADWNYTSTVQPGLAGRTIDYPRGRVLGGSSSINYMIWNTGSSDDWDRYARVTGDSGWSWKAIQPFIKKVERIVPPADNHNTTGEYIPSIHGTSGPLGISLQGYPSLLDSRVIATTEQLSAEFPLNPDMNSGNPIGIGYSQFSVENGSRTSSATAYLEPALSSGSNLDVLVNTQVTKLFQTGTEQGLPAIRGVQFAQSAEGPFYVVNATTEVILSAGAIGTPQLLLLSGIGGSADLKKLGINTLVNLPDVGKNLQDHTVLPNIWSINATQTPDDYARNATLINDDLTQWATTGTGQLATPPATNIGWFRLPKNASIFDTLTDPSAGPTSPHYEFIFAEVWDSFTLPTPTTGHYMILSSNLFTPTSRGSVTLNTTNPFDFPIIDPALLNSAFDIYTIREAVKAAQRFMAAPAWDGFVIEQAGNFAGVTTDAEVEAYARANAATVFHPVGTAAMSPKGASSGVVDPNLTVKGTRGLRIVDASIFPYVPSMHPQGLVYLVAERAVTLIKAGC
ncbi:GMC oxidoreductase [Auriscalpium vulgare]|uniref:GMC oxidoreductase n=1 Tax=Auriscalpium vulgare TaxID=40419 RepID=A0ACB8S9D9_9AGAM|nr:GMC oxidoreductase [Auriscalpium vulgare]